MCNCATLPRNPRMSEREIKTGLCGHCFGLTNYGYCKTDYLHEFFNCICHHHFMSSVNDNEICVVYNEFKDHLQEANLSKRTK